MTVHIAIGDALGQPGDGVCAVERLRAAALRRLGRIEPRNSAAGHYLIALARRAGIKTLAVVRREDAANEVRRLGADLVVLEGEDLGSVSGRRWIGADCEFCSRELADPREVAQLVGAVEDGGSVITFAAVTGQAPVLPLPDLIYRGISLRGFFILNWLRDTTERFERVYAQKNARTGKVLFTPVGVPKDAVHDDDIVRVRRRFRSPTITETRRFRVRVRRVRVARYVRGELTITFVSELCHIPPSNPGEERHLRGHVDADRCCVKLLIGTALVAFRVRQHARAESISKRAP